VPRVTLPAGKTVVEVARMLGVDAADLARRAGLTDVDAPLRVARSVDLPDGFLRQQDRDRRSIQARVPRTDAAGGMTPALAASLEHRRRQTALGPQADAEEEDALARARGAYLRFEPDSNDLAVTLFRQLAARGRAATRGPAAAGEALALAHAVWLFGRPRALRNQALSAAQGAIMAAPREARGHEALALALAIEPADEAYARATLAHCLHLAPEDPWVWGTAARLQRSCGEDSDAALARALALDPDNVLALELAGLQAHARGEDAAGWWQRALQVRPSYATPRVWLALAADPDTARRLWQGLAEDVQDQAFLAFLKQLALGNG
jgi:hypothetical protein